MDKQLDTRFDRVEKALGTLADSIAKYNPSTHSAREFVAADAELSKGLEERAFYSEFCRKSEGERHMRIY